MSHPLPVGHRTVTAGWKYSSGTIHAGFDYSVPIGTPVFAVRKGRILKVVDNVKNLAPHQNGFSGAPVNFILQAIMFNGEPATVLYLHISPHAPVNEGDTVFDGQQIARSGHNGNSTGPHLHIAVWKGHRSLRPFRYLDGLSNSSPRPDGLAENGITIFPPRLVFTTAPPVDLLPADVVLMKDLKAGTRNSESVRRLQRRLNKINLPGSVQLPASGNYLKQTRAEVKRWQMAKFGHPATSPKADGNLLRPQAKILFGPTVTVR